MNESTRPPTLTQEPVAWMEYDNSGHSLGPTTDPDGFWPTKPLYLHPAPRSSTDAKREQEPVAWRYRLRARKADRQSLWRYVDSGNDCNPSAMYEREPLYAFPWDFPARFSAKPTQEQIGAARRVVEGPFTTQDAVKAAHGCLASLDEKGAT